MPSQSRMEMTPYARGFSDAADSRPYSDGYSPRHDLNVLFPGWVFTAPIQRQYREGWLAGNAVLRFYQPRDRDLELCGGIGCVEAKQPI